MMHWTGDTDPLAEEIEQAKNKKIEALSPQKNWFKNKKSPHIYWDPFSGMLVSATSLSSLGLSSSAWIFPIDSALGAGSSVTSSLPRI